MLEPRTDESRVIDSALTKTQTVNIRPVREGPITQLSDALTAAPNDDWIAGQLKRFTYDQQEPGRTIAAAGRCVNRSAMCASLRGLALEQANDVQEAERAFRDAEFLPDLEGKPVGDQMKSCSDRETVCHNHVEWQ